jgi:excisionase family DNA binding protein
MGNAAGFLALGGTRRHCVAIGWPLGYDCGSMRSVPHRTRSTRMLTVADEREPIAPTEAERDGLEELNRLLKERGPLGWSLLGPNGDRIALPEAALRALRQVTDVLAQDRVVVVRRMSRQLTVDQAADLLELPSAEVASLIDRGVLTSRTVRNRRRVHLDDVIELKRRHDGERRENLRRLSAQGQEIESLLD